MPNELNFMKSASYVAIPLENDVRLRIKPKIFATKLDLLDYSPEM